jgi:signal transduction histidine kinase
VKNSSDIDVRGSGLGLTLVKHVIDAHGWQIDVDSIQGQGTTFSITVPTNPEYKKVS